MDRAELRPVQIEGLPVVDWGPEQLHERYPDSVAGAAVYSLCYLREVEPGDDR